MKQDFFRSVFSESTDLVDSSSAAYLIEFDTKLVPASIKPADGRKKTTKNRRKPLLLSSPLDAAGPFRRNVFHTDSLENHVENPTLKPAVVARCHS